ncbi:hypothetical protein NQ317_013719 [Molorchus minor]|uniref:Ku70/Ku80 N-terminal alpha/beta domain-containing protein n=1 Tax=Molorchus minor TaxID=1323400 RepID=A0ABQ9JNY6_9CUCU|nr:hypothetical protein NQ317_013719 [Molorchus minor]
MSSTNYYAADSDDEGEDQVFLKPSFVVIAIDVHPIMFQERNDGSMPFRDCIETCYNLADSLVLTSSHKFNQFALILAREDLPILTEFDANLLDSVKLLKVKTEMSNQQLKDEYQRKGDFDLASFFLTCKKAFHDIKSTFDKRTLIYITDDESPAQNAQQKFTALNEAKTFSGSQINFQIIPTRIDFNYNVFYNELFSLMDITPVEEICEDKDGLMKKLLSSVVIQHSQTNMRFYPFNGDPTRFINCFKVNVIRSSTLLNTRVTKDGRPVKRVTESDNIPSFSFKNKVPECDTIKFDLYEKTTLLDNRFPLGLTLLYVSKRLTDVGYVLGKPFLLRQNEEFESPLFKKFWQNCVNNERVLVCARKLQQPGKLRYVELIPEVVNGSSMFLVKNVPYSSEIVYPIESDYPEQVEDVKKKEAMKKLVDDLTFDFDFKMIPDPCYRKKQAYVKAKLLDEQMKEVTDITFNLPAMDEHLQEAVNAIKSNYVLTEEKKRKAPSSTSKAKKTK